MNPKRVVRRTDIKVEPKRTIVRSENFATIVADYAKVTIHRDTKMCTFTFFQTHPVPKMDPKGIILDSLEQEMRLEIKMPFGTAFALAVYMNDVLDEIRENPEGTRSYFGPSLIEEGKEKQ